MNDHLDGATETPKGRLEILVVDDDPLQLDLLERFFARKGHRVTTTQDGRMATEIVRTREVDLVITDLVMPGVDGLAVLEQVKALKPDTEVVLITGMGSEEAAIKALRLHAYDYFQKPIDLQRLELVAGRIAEKRRLQAENILLRRQLDERRRCGEFIGMSAQVQDIYDIIARVAENDATVLNQGESGTGKELVAKAIHQSSPRRGQPFVPVNCGAIVEGLLESELFGHVKGAFTGAVRDSLGLFRAAESGTVFLDEIAEVVLPLQVKLLRALQERKIRPVGAEREVPIDVRVIAATNRDLEEAIKSGDLRKDLFYRLNVVPINVPPLRERKEDIPLLVTHFIERFNQRHGRDVKGITPEAIDRLLSYSWPGNVRELENVIERAFALGAYPMISAKDIPIEQMRQGADIVGPGSISTLKESEIMMIRRTLEHTGSDKTRSARILGIDRATLYRKIKKYGIEE